MKVTDNAINIIKKYESYVAKPYLCPAKVWTIGYGSTYINSKPVKQTTQPISEAKAAEILKDSLVDIEKIIALNIGHEITQNQFDALASFIYNVGQGSFINSTMLKHLKGKRYPEAADEFDKWTLSKGKALTGLIVRRKEEKQLFLS